ncbi:hypothetical protein SAMN05421858_0870 [Haladaptatus litoreus]|uniref:Cox cluster protein n=1 Tax=Haladaptatus litoreus TaxID=553468 RepID=A0A1N6WU88_9EURY|nr:cox cluster protein [Haladaptatus litoreus]SIQ93667.1 hypothetical protein SAMN05421858_0870 [Haladaptatus litoreus]
MPSRFHGRWLVVGLYALIVSFAGFVGVLLGLYGPEDMRPVSLLGLIEIQPTAIGLAIFGMTTIGLFLGILLFLVMFVSERYDDADPKV